MHNLGFSDKHFDMDYMVGSIFPFYVDMETKELTIIASITVSAAAASSKQILSFEELKELVVFNYL